ncbi:SusD/RagB family nutrient-binding outer membrane lipoprotein [Marinilongibacter aquaticus]|uniref:SusD/RagB family nutrient-binding outer membrane lipoprotein n=1 Tax=Marinilongibacter aquaticus TaxID=2975157 RepID=UPI0021BDAFC2|nr:SusD/RagB family nutrient-binding outer membrane lipoprotein [Marinilongibacter aquaticus]UBM57239.1 SusD/RagB family nutrient-binding outer membrane lipoprotein [Marinilongibacter aquaticus]
MMKRNSSRFVLVFVLLFLGLQSCTKDFEEINLNPTAPVDVQPEFLLRQVLFNYSDNMSYEGFVAGNLLGQLFTAIDFNLFDRHGLSQSQYGGNPWSFLYQNLRDNEILLKKSETEPAAKVYQGPALILKALFTAQLTDLYGDVPYSEALQGKAGNVRPKYDSQRDIYLAENGILDNLENGLEALEAYQSAIPLNGDIVFSGDLDKWKKFANSLRLKYLLRIADKEDVSAKIKAIYTEGNYIQDISEDAVYHFTASQPNNFRMSTARIGDFGLFIMSETIEEELKKLNDPRMATYFRPTGADANVYHGLLNGPDASQLSISVADYSLSGTIFREEADKVKANFMTSYETKFVLAEAALRGFIEANPQVLYEEGVRDAFAYWYTVMPETYLSDGPAAFQSSSALEQIITQKWLANIINGYEGWIEYRRTGFPALKTISASLNNDLIPVRLPYPTTEDALNNANFTEAAGRTEGNSINAKVWWDVQD